MKKTTLAIIIAIVAVGALGGIYFFNQSDSTKDQTTTTSQPGDTSTATEAKSYTTAQVAKHNSNDDCWTIVSGNVYDITSYIARHPGGEGIVSACGTDSTTLFTERKTESGESVGSGTPHSSRASAQLETLKIGTLAN